MRQFPVCYGRLTCNYVYRSVETTFEVLGYATAFLKIFGIFWNLLTEEKQGKISTFSGYGQSVPKISLKIGKF